MKKSTMTSAVLIFTFALSTLSMSCQRSDTSEAKVNFVRTSTERAILEERDLEDTFLFGLNVIETKGFFSTALNLNFRPVESRLQIVTSDWGQQQLVVTQQNSNRSEKLLSFNVKKTADNKLEVDFATAGNEISLWNGIGGATVDFDAGKDAGSWKTIAEPKVIRIEQDPDTVVVDLLHRVSFSLTQASPNGDQSRSGEVKIRLFLKRQERKPALLSRTASLGRAQNIGFFPAASRLGMDDTLPIAHYKIDVQSRKPGQQIIYLKDFPEEYADVGRRAVESWNISFGFAAFKTAIAEEHIDLGDPRYNVIKWIDGLDEEVPWAGYAPTMVNPITGEVLATQILINGSTTRKGFEQIYNYTAEASPQLGKLIGKIGQVPLVEGAGESPVVTFFADTNSKTANEYIRGYYQSVIMHEFGHSLGLRHNFAASTKIDSNGISSSVMDYEPGFVTNIRTLPGSYDTAAIRWGYFGENPGTPITFCTDEDISKRYDCNQGDLGHPVDYVVAGLIQGTTVLENLVVPLPDMVQKPMRGMMKTALKILELNTQLPEQNRQAAISEIQRALERVRLAAPANELGANERSVVDSNLKKLANSYSEALSTKRAPIAFIQGL